MERGVIKLGVTKEKLLSRTEVNTLQLDSLSVNASKFTSLFTPVSRCTHHIHETHERRTRFVQVSSLLATFHSLVSTGKDAGFVRAWKEDYKCRFFYYLALKAQYAATVIISTAVLFYKIVKDDETTLLESELALSLVTEGSARRSIFPASVAGDEPQDVSRPTLLLCRQL